MLEISCAFATSLETPAHVAQAEELGYRRAWLYDSPALYPDVWAVMALAATRTSHIGLGPGVLVPSLRHPVVTAAAIATLCGLAPGRIDVAIGSGFTGRMTMGQRALSWRYVRNYTEVLKALLAGGTAEWEGRAVAMMHPPGFTPALPLRVPLLLGTAGPRGLAAAREVADGVFVGGAGVAGGGPGWRCAVLAMGTVLGEGEDPGAARVLAAAGHASSTGLHYAYEHDRARLASMPGGPEWLARVERISERERHIAMHALHLVGVNEIDAPFVTGERLRAQGLALTAEEWRARLARLESEGATEIAYQPAGPDIPGELERFARAAGLQEHGQG